MPPLDETQLAVQIAVMNTQLENLTKALSNGAFKNVTEAMKEGNALVVKAVEGLMIYQKEEAKLRKDEQEKMCGKLDKVYGSNKWLITIFSILTLTLFLQSIGVLK